MWEVAIETFTYAYISHSIQVSMATSHITHIPPTYPGTSIYPTLSLQDIGGNNKSYPESHPLFTVSLGLLSPPIPKG
jgi:hypothetical protein